MSEQTITLEKCSYLLNDHFTFNLSNIKYCKPLKEIVEELKTIKSNEIKIFDADKNEFIIYYAKARIIKNTNTPKITKINGHGVKINDIEKLRNILIFTDRENLLKFII